MQKITFLDFDGVLQTENHSNPWKGQVTRLKGYTDRDQHGLLFDHACVQRLQQLIKTTKAAIVISSSWRYEGLEKMTKMWEERKMPGKLLGITTTDETISSRGEEIQNWLDENPCAGFVIIDDVNDFLEIQQGHFVKTEYYSGFQEDDLKKAINILST